MARSRERERERRCRMVAIATALFCERGYSHATMSMISARIGGSKATLWSYFRSKEELFVASMEAIRAHWDELTVILTDTNEEDFTQVLERFGCAYLKLASTKEALMIRRTIIGSYEISKLVGSDFVAPVRQRLSDYLLGQTTRGKIRAIDHDLCSQVLIALLDAGYIDKLLYGVKPIACEDHVRHSVKFFIRGL